MKSRNHAQKNAKQSSSKASGGVGKKLRRISISDDSDTASVDLESQIPEFLDLQEYDLVTKCPTFKLICDRDSNHTATLNADELDNVQFELEKLLFHTVTKSKCIAESLNDLNDARGASSSGSAGPSTSSNLRSSSNAALQSDSKRSKVKFASTTVSAVSAAAATSAEISSKRTAMIASLSPLKIKPPKVNRSEHVTTSERSALSPGSSRLYLWPQNQMPDKFIHFIDNYAGHIPSDVIFKLKQLAEESDRSKSAEYYDVPDLGKHYSLRKTDPPLSPVESNHKGSTKEKLNKNSSKNSTKVKNGDAVVADHSAKVSSSRSQSTRLSSVKTKSTPSVDKEDDQFSLGPLTERLVQALIEENAFEPTFDEMECNDLSIHNGPTPNSTPAKSLLKSLNLGNMAALERRIRKELEEQGLLNFDESDYTAETDGTVDPEDEVFTELKQRQKELESVQKTNYERLQLLLTKCETAVDRQNLEDRIKSADDQVLDLFSHFYGITPVVRKPSTKKEKDQLWKALKDREKLLDELKVLNVSC